MTNESWREALLAEIATFEPDCCGNFDPDSDVPGGCCGKFEPREKTYDEIVAAIRNFPIPEHQERKAERVRELEAAILGAYEDGVEHAFEAANRRAELAEQQLAECRKDAERYRWLKKGGDYYLYCINPDAGHIEGENLDLIIDRAELAETKGEKP